MTNKKTSQTEIKALEEFTKSLIPEDFDDSNNYDKTISNLNSSYENSKMALALSSGKAFCRYFFRNNKQLIIRGKSNHAYIMFDLKGVDFLDKEHEKYIFRTMLDYDIGKFSGYSFGRLILENHNNLYLLRYGDVYKGDSTEKNIGMSKCYPNFKDNINYGLKEIACEVVKDKVDKYINMINKKED